MPGPPTIERLLRPGLLDGRRIAVAGMTSGARPAGWAGAVTEACAGLGASVCALAAESEDEEAVSAVEATGRAAGTPDVLVVDGAGLFATAGGAAGNADRDGVAALRACLDGAWSATRAVATRVFIPGERGGRILLLAPAPTAGARASAAAAGLENLARTLSIEWARLGITVAAIAPGDATGGEEVGALVAFLASPAGAYYSGCLLDLRGV